MSRGGSRRDIDVACTGIVLRDRWSLEWFCRWAIAVRSVQQHASLTPSMHGSAARLILQRACSMWSAATCRSKRWRIGGARASATAPDHDATQCGGGVAATQVVEGATIDSPSLSSPRSLGTLGPDARPRSRGRSRGAEGEELHAAMVRLSEVPASLGLSAGVDCGDAEQAH